MPIGTDFEIQNDRDIRYTGAAHGVAGAGYYTVLAFHEWLRDKADDAQAAGDDFMDITKPTPSEKAYDTIVSLINGYNVDDTASEHLYQGSTLQDGGNVIYDGIQVVAAEGCDVQIVQNGSVIASDFWNTIPDGQSTKGLNRDVANGIACRFMLKVRTGAADIDGRRLICQTREWQKTFSEFKVNGTGRGVNVVPLTYASDLNNTTTDSTVAGYDDIVNDRTDSGTTVDGVNVITSTTLNVINGGAFSTGEIIAINDGGELGQYQITSITANALTITPGLDVATVGGETIWKIGYGYESIDVDNNGTYESYYTKWDKGTRSINQFYERMKYLSKRETTNRLFGLNAEVLRGITHEIVADTLTGTFKACEAVSWTGGTGRMFGMIFPDTGAGALTINVVAATGTFTRTTGSYITDGFKKGMTIVTSGFTGGNNTTKIISTVTATVITVTDVTGLANETGTNDERVKSGHMWIQLLTGVAPTDNQTITGTISTATCLMNVTITERILSFPFCGNSTGTAIIGAYGFGIEATDLSASDKVTALDNVVYQAPNWVTFVIGGLLYPSEDYVMIGPRGYRFAYDNEATGPFQVGETLTFTSPAGTAKLADLFDQGTWGFMYIGPMLTGTVPTDNSGITGGTSTATANVNGAVSNEVDLQQLTLNGLLNGAAVTSVVVNESIPADTPLTGTIRIKRTSGRFSRHPYSAWDGTAKTFTITSHDFSSDTAPNGSQVFISYIDMVADSATEQFTGVYVADRSLFIRVRNGGVTSPIKTFETTGVNGAAGGTATAVRTSDI